LVDASGEPVLPIEFHSHEIEDVVGHAGGNEGNVIATVDALASTHGERLGSTLFGIRPNKDVSVDSVENVFGRDDELEALVAQCRSDQTGSTSAEPSLGSGADENHALACIVANSHWKLQSFNVCRPAPESE
jgi:hypothetical protein